MKKILVIFALLWALGASGQIYIDSYRFGAGAPPATLLLDDYPNAAAAYSLRKLRTAYTGNCIVVRRSSNNDTLAVGFSGNYLDTVALKTFCSGTDCFVWRWYEQSGNALDAVQTTSASQPAIVTSGAIIYQSSLPAIDFDGSNDFMLVSGVFTNSNITSFAVAETDTPSANGYIYDNSNSTETGGGYTLRFVNNLQIRAWTQNAIRNASGGSISANVQYLLEHTGTIVTTTETNTIFLNGTQVGTDSGSALARSAKTQTRIGHSELLAGYLNGNIAEIVVYSNNQSSNLAGIRSNINSFYTIY